jgi:DNA-binding transcriptional regulator YiaG
MRKSGDRTEKGGGWIKRKRLELGIERGTVAGLLSVSEMTVWRWEERGHRVRRLYLRVLGEYFERMKVSDA